MDTNLLYDRVCAVKRIDQENFLDRLNYTLTELCSIYGEEWVMAAPFRRIERVGEQAQVKDIYSVAVEDNILYLITGDARHKTDFTAHAKYAYNTLWREKEYGQTDQKGGVVMYKSSMRVSELLSLARDSADIAPCVDDGYYLMWLSALEAQLYTGIIRECGVYTCQVTDGVIDLSLIEEEGDCALPRECDVREIFLDGREFTLVCCADMPRHPERSLFYTERGEAHLHSPYGVTGSAQVIYLRRPKARSENSRSEYVALPDEFLPMALDYLVGCAYALVCDDTQAANRFAAYNAALEDFIAWQEKNRGGMR